MQFYQPIDGYCYNSDTYCLYNFICLNLTIFKNIQGELLDIGSGSGILGLLLAKKYSELNLNSCEVQDSFSFLSKKNAEINNINITMINENFINHKFDKTYDIVVSNPPFYLPNVVQSKNKNIKIARYNDNLPLEVLIQKTSNILNNKGKFFFCYDVKLLNAIILLFKKYKLNIEAMQFVYPKKDKNASLVMVYARKNSKSLMNILSPFIMFENDKLSNKIIEIYKICNTHSIKVEL
jgi:tRNA1(Val) A37 N6-methylase TrmN6